MGKKSGHSGDLDFLSEDLPKNKITREVALQELKRFLSERNLLKKTVKRAERSEDDKENFESAKEVLLGAIMDGSVVIGDDKPCKLIHHLTDPPLGKDGNHLYEFLEYSFVPDLTALRRLDKFGEDESIAKTQALLGAMVEKSPGELAKISSRDLDVIASVAFFFV